MPEPILDVVIPVHGRPDWLLACVRCLDSFTTNPFRLILVDNCSQDAETKEVLVAFQQRWSDTVQADRARGRPELLVLRRGVNDSFAASVNQGIGLGKAPYVVILNSDVLVTPGWDTIALAELAEERVGMVGLQGNGSGLQGNGAAAGWAKPNYLIFFAVVTRRATWEAVGPMDAATFCDWSGGEDLDWSWRAVDSGYELRVSRAGVHHGGSQTYRTFMGPEEQLEKHRVAQLRLLAKHGAARHARGTKEGWRLLVGLLSGTPLTQVGFARNLIVGLSAIRGLKKEIIWIERQATHMARETICDYALEQDFDAVLMIDDDMRFPNDLAPRLIAADKDVVGIVAYSRGAPHKTCVFEWSEAANGYVPLEGCEHTGLRKVGAVGMGAVLIKAETLRRVKKPRFEWARMGEDLDFCTKAREAGCEIYADTEIVLGHVADAVVIDEAYKRAYVTAQEKGQVE